MKKMKPILSWILAVTMLLTNIEYAHATDISADVSSGDISIGNVSVNDVSEGEISTNDGSEEDVTSNDVSEGDVLSAGAVKVLHSGKEAGVTWKITSDGVLTISGEKQAGVTEPIDRKWLNYKDKFTKVVVTARNINSTAYWFYDCSKVTEFDLSGFDTSTVTDMRWMFGGCTALTTLDVSNFDTSNVTDMAIMFYNCNSLETLNITGFDTSNVTDMSWMFYNCQKLKSLDVSGFDTSKVTDMSYMLANLKGLTELDVSGFDTSKVTNMNNMFSGNSELTTLDVSRFDTSNVTDMSMMFWYCEKLTTLDVSGFDTSNVTDMSMMFANCEKLMTLDVSGFNTSKVTNMLQMFSYNIALTELDVSGFNTSNVTNMKNMFSHCRNLTTLDVSGFDTSNVTDMRNMFSYCKKISVLDVSGFDTSKVTAMYSMFYECRELEELDVSRFDTSNVDNLFCVFFGCEKLKKLDVSGFKTEKCNSMDGLFYECSSLTQLDVSGFDTSNVTDMDIMFYGCNSLIQLDVSGFDTSNVTDMSQMFYNCSSLIQLDVSGFDTSNVTSMSAMFQKCSSLLELDVSGFDMARVVNANNMFDDCDAMEKFKTFVNTNLDIYLPAYPLYANNYSYRMMPKNMKNPMYLYNTRGKYTVMFDNGMDEETIDITDISEGDLITLPEDPVREGYTFAGWYTEEYGAGTKFTADTAINKDYYLYASWVGNGFWVSEVAPQTYTGKAIKPAIKVFDGDRLLKENVDYTVSYKNNVKANDASVAKTAPTIIVKGKGNYTGKETVTFQILPKDVYFSDVVAADIIKNVNNKVQKPVPTLAYNGKKLVNKRDFTVSYPDSDDGDYKKAGTYEIVVTGKGNYTGEKVIKLTLTDKILISKVKVAAIPDQEYTGSYLRPELKLTYKGETLEKNKDYGVYYSNNEGIGTATVTITGWGEYTGSRDVTFQIVGKPISKAEVLGIENKVYNGSKQEQDLYLKYDGTRIYSYSSYEVFYENNIDVGTATVIIQGKGQYEGTIKKTFKITPYDIGKADGSISSSFQNMEVLYEKGGSMPSPELEWFGTTLQKGKDYTISYKNNKKPALSTDKKAPTIIIKGKGNFKGTITVPFTILAKDLSDKENPVNISATDVAYSAKAGKFMVKPVLTDSNGKKLVAGTDYEKNLVYTKADGTVLTKKDVAQVGDVITVTAIGKGSYTGSISTTYRVTQASFGSAKITIKTQGYTGEALTLDEEDITVKVGKTELKYGEDYVIVEDSYKNNIKKGTASVTIKGINNYGGSKTVKFKITSKKMVWFWNLF